MSSESGDDFGSDYEGIQCRRCQFDLDEPFVCKRVECLDILCSICRSTHAHADDVISAGDSLATIRPFIERYQRSIRDCVTKVMSRRARSEFEAITRLDRTADVKRQIHEWCGKMRDVIDQAEATLLNTVEKMETDFRSQADKLIKDLRSLERDYKNVHELRTAYNAKQLTPKQAFKLFALMKKYEDTLADPSKTDETPQWEQTYLAFVPNDDAMTALKSTAYVCGKIRSNIQLSIESKLDRSAGCIRGMTLMGNRLALTDKYNRSVKIFSRPINCGLFGEAVETTVISAMKQDDKIVEFFTPGDIQYDSQRHLLILSDEQEGRVDALNPDTGALQWRLETKRPSGVAINKKLIFVCSEYEKTIESFKWTNLKKHASSLLKDHPLSLAANMKGDVALCTIHGRMSILNSDLKQQKIVDQFIDGEVFRPQRVCAMSNGRFLSCDTQRVLEIEANCIVKRTVLLANTPGNSIPELPAAICCDAQRNIYMAFHNYVKVFPVPLEIVPPDELSDSTPTTNSTQASSEQDSNIEKSLYDIIEPL